MPALKPGEVHNPRKGVCDTQIVGEGILEFDRSDGRFIAASLRFQDEGEFFKPADRDDESRDYAKIDLYSNPMDYVAQGVSEEDAEELSAAVRTLLKYVDLAIPG